MTRSGYDLEEATMVSEYQLTLTPKTPATAEPRAREVLEATLQSLRFIPNMYAVMANSPGLLETYEAGYRRFREESGFTPAEQEVVLLTISRENGCEYCVAAHSVLADAVSKVPAAVTEAIRTGCDLPDARLAALSRFTTTMVAARGLPSRREVQEFLAAGYTERHILEVILAIAVKTISNYANHLFHTPLDPMFSARAWNELNLSHPASC
jgi:uncharacterized peroxidase-related enzyme